MREQTRVVLTVARDPLLARIELSYLGFNMAEYATWLAILVFAYDLGGAGTAALFATVVLIPAGSSRRFASSFGDRFRQDRVLLAGYVWRAVSLLATGRVQVVADGVVIAERSAVDPLGEIALLRNVPRTATVTALTPLRLIAIERERFLEAVTGHAQSRAHAEAVAHERSPLR